MRVLYGWGLQGFSLLLVPMERAPEVSYPIAQMCTLPVPPLWVIPVPQPQASCIMHGTWTGDLFHIRYYTCFQKWFCSCLILSPLFLSKLNECFTQVLENYKNLLCARLDVLPFHRMFAFSAAVRSVLCVS